MLLRFAKRYVPYISPTERTALESGGFSIDRLIFQGNSRNIMEKLKSYKTHLSSRENNVNNLCKRTDKYNIHKNNNLSEEQWKYIKENKFFGLCIPDRYDGLQFSQHAHSKIIEKISSRCPSTAVTVMVPNSLGPSELLLKYGTEHQKNIYLPKLANGKLIPCFGLTGPNNGSDAIGQIDSGELHEENGVKGIRFKCNKRWITLAPVADLVGLAINVKGYGTTLLLIDSKTKNLVIGQRHYPIGGAFMNGPITCNGEIFVPLECIIGGPNYLGQGWKMLMECLTEGRGVSLPALASGINKYLAIQTTYYSIARKQFNLSLINMEGVQEKLAKINENAYIIMAMQELYNSILLKHENSSMLSAVMKYKTTELARESINHSMDIFAGKGISTGEKNNLSHYYNQIPIAITVEGSNTITRSLIIFGQGLNKSHPYVGSLLKAIESNNTREFNELLIKFGYYNITNLAKSIFYGLLPIKNTDLQIDRFTSIFIFISNLLLLRGKQIKSDQVQSGRMADVFCNLFIIYALKNININQEIEELIIKRKLYEIELLFDKICIDLVGGTIIKFLIKPFGQINTEIRVHEIKKLSRILRDTNLDDIFAKDIYIDNDDPIMEYRHLLKNKYYIDQSIKDEIIQVDVY
jgi:alkylation response protein AidB-like acyl-CoA dehydrogenase